MNLEGTCRGCGSPGFSLSTGCKACGYKSTAVYPKLVSLPSPRSVPEREGQIRTLVEYAVRTGDIAGAVQAIASGMTPEGSEIVKLFVKEGRK